MKVSFLFIPLGLRQVLEDFVDQPEEGAAGADVCEQQDPSNILEVQNAESELAEISAEDIDSVLAKFDLTQYILSVSPTASSPSLQTNSTSFEKFSAISKSLEESSNITPDSFVDIVQQSLSDPSVFGYDAFDFSF